MKPKTILAAAIVLLALSFSGVAQARPIDDDCFGCYHAIVTSACTQLVMGEWVKNWTSNPVRVSLVLGNQDITTALQPGDAVYTHQDYDTAWSNCPDKEH